MRDPKELKEIMYVIVVDFSQVILLDALKRRSIEAREKGEEQQFKKRRRDACR